MKSKTKNKLFLIMIGILLSFASIWTRNLCIHVHSGDSLDNQTELKMPKSAYTIDWAPNGTAICTVLGEQTDPRICPDGGGGAIIIWTDGRGVSYDIYAQRVDSNGALKWHSQAIAICTASGEQYPSWLTGPVSDGVGGAIITWIDKRGGQDSGIYAQRVDSNGAIKWIPNGTAISTASDAKYPQICTDGEEGAIITWYDKRNGQDFDIFTQKIDSTGNLKWADGGVPLCTISGDQYVSHICSDGMGGAIIVWRDYTNVVDSDIYAQRVDSNGAIKWTDQGVPICTASNHQILPIICPDGTGGAIITWSDARNLLDTDWDIYAQRVDINGVRKWTAQGIPICTESDAQGTPSICSDGTGGAFITWEDYRGEYTDNYAQHIDTNGATKWDTNGTAICTENNYQDVPQVCSDGAGGAIISWMDRRTGGFYDIYAQYINANEIIKGEINGTAICTSDNDQSFPVICSDGDHGVIITWMDERIGDLNIYAQHIDNPIPISHITGDNDDDDDDKEAEEISLLPVIGIVGGSIAGAGIAIIIAWKKQLFTKKPRDINE